jgi:hypothetical protein
MTNVLNILLNSTMRFTCPSHTILPDLIILLTYEASHCAKRIAVQKFLPIDLFNPTSYLIHSTFNIQQLYIQPTLYLCVLFLSQNKQRLLPCITPVY